MMRNFFKQYRVKKVRKDGVDAYTIQHKFLGIFWYKPFVNTLDSFKKAKDVVNILRG